MAKPTNKNVKESFLEKTKKQPDTFKKKKLGEGSQESRMQRVSFKKYLREIEDQFYNDEEDDDFEDK